MTIRLGGSASGAVVPVLDIRDSPGVDNSGIQTSGGNGNPFVSGSTVSLFWDDILGAGFLYENAANGMRVRATAPLGGHGARTQLLHWPLPERRALAGLSDTLLGVRRYTFEMVVTVAGVSCEIGVRNSAQPLAIANTILGYSLRNVAGIWTPVSRLVTGALEAFPAALSAPTAGVPRLFQAVYTEGQIPEFSLLIDRVAVMTVQGVANMPEVPVVNSLKYGPAFANGAASACRGYGSRLLVEQLS